MKSSKRERTGTIEKQIDASGRTKYRARIRIADGSRAGVAIPEKYGATDQGARSYAEALQQREDQKGVR